MKRLLLIAFATVAPLFAYTPPKGIPNPATQFGWEIDRPTPAWPAEWTATVPTSVANYYYVDKTSIVATDTANPYGNPTLPRKSIPEGSLSAGAYIYVHAGTYDTNDSAGPNYNWSGVGTVANPIWITGNPTTHPVIQDSCIIGDGGNTSYLVFENFDIKAASSALAGYAGLGIRPTTNGHNIDHVLVRNITRTGFNVVSDLTGIEIGNSVSPGSDPIANSTLTDIVVYKCTISNLGDPSPTGSDDCGVYNAYHTDRIWVLDNTIHDVGADGVAGSHYSDYTTRTTENYFIGRNTIYHNGENGIDLKGVHNAVISENDISGPFSREQGWAIVLHYGFNTGFRCRNVYVLFNRIHHVSAGIGTGLSSGADDLTMIGNVFYDIKASYAFQADPLNGYALQLGGSHGTFRIVNNTFHDYDGGLRLQSLTTGDAVKVHGNIFSARSDLLAFDIFTINGQEGFVTTDYNFYSGTPQFFWTSNTRTLAFMSTTAGQEAHSLSGSAAFVNAAGADFHLSVTSPAIDASVEGPVGDSVYGGYPTSWDAAIRRDFDGRNRPVDTFWDMGAFESALPPAPAPSGLQVTP